MPGVQVTPLTKREAKRIRKTVDTIKRILKKKGVKTAKTFVPRAGECGKGEIEMRDGATIYVHRLGNANLYIEGFGSFPIDLKKWVSIWKV
jgi:hypothetical protein